MPFQYAPFVKKFSDINDENTPKTLPSLPEANPDFSSMLSGVIERNRSDISYPEFPDSSSVSRTSDEELLKRLNEINANKANPASSSGTPTNSVADDKLDNPESETAASNNTSNEDNAIKNLMEKIRANNSDDADRASKIKMMANLGKSSDLVASGLASMINKAKIADIINPSWGDQIKQADSLVAQGDKENALLSKQILTQEMLKAKKEASQLKTQEKADVSKEKKQQKIEELTQSFRKELTGGNLGKMYNAVMAANRAKMLIEDARRDPNGFKDFGILLNTLRALQGDDSVIRGPELKMGQEVGSILDRIEGPIRRLKSGETLTARQREMLSEASDSLIGAAKRQAGVMFGPTLTQADELGIPRRKLIGTNLLDDTEVKDVSSSTSKKATSATVNVKNKLTGEVLPIPQEAAKKLIMNSNFQIVD